MNLCKEILLGLFLLFAAFFIGRRLLAPCRRGLRHPSKLSHPAA